jgi:hypothetical protein
MITPWALLFDDKMRVSRGFERILIRKLADSNCW